MRRGRLVVWTAVAPGVIACATLSAPHPRMRPPGAGPRACPARRHVSRAGAIITLRTLRVAFFVSPHGFGHAARASAVMEALHRLGGARFEVFSASPPWFFDETVAGLYRHHHVVTDVGFRQRSALVYDLPATVAALEAMLPFDDQRVEALARVLRDAGCAAVVCDIAPLGVAVAERAGVPSLLVENFTWPWLYEPLVREAPALGPLAQEMEAWLGRATWHVQTDPLCAPDPSADLRVGPIGRRARGTRAGTRRALGLPEAARVVLVTMGGVPEELPFLDRLRDEKDVDFVVTGAPATREEGNLHLHDARARLYLPDLVRAADAVVAKLGYSTIAEVSAEGRPLARVTRPAFRETEPLRRWVDRELPGFEITAREFSDGSWVGRVPELLGIEPPPPQPGQGADVVARFLLEKLEGR